MKIFAYIIFFVTKRSFGEEPNLCGKFLQFACIRPIYTVHVQLVCMRYACDTNCFVQIKPATCLRLTCTTQRMSWDLKHVFDATTIVATRNFLLWKSYTIFHDPSSAPIKIACDSRKQTSYCGNRRSGG